ncbi:MAG: pantoate--beta-alanine ligase [Alphaproteobacteria bacterium]
MRVFHTAQELSNHITPLQSNGQRIGFVPTMGALHEGHLALCEVARNAGRADALVVSIFVNPTQFAPHEDLDTYPRTLETDCAKLKARGVEMVYAPSINEIYPDGAAAYLKAGAAAHGLESDFRPHFFDGVVSVVHTLFAQVRPDLAVFGEKDFQQLMVIREMVKTQNLAIDILAGATIRDEYGLALSSRNSYLSAEELEIARMLNQIIFKTADDIRNGQPPQTATANGRDMLENCGFDKIDYLAFHEDWRRVLVAAWLGKTRLIDNCAV